MSSPIIDQIEKEQMKNDVPNIRVGDKVKVASIIKEGKKQRTQFYEGIVIALKHAFSRQSMTVRKIVDSVGVEKTFLLHSPVVTNIQIIKKGKARRAKLFYLRDRIGSKATFVKSREVKRVKA